MRSDGDFSGKRCLVTGVAGFIGANLARELLARGAEVHGTVRNGSERWRIRDIAAELALHDADLTDPDSLARAARLAAPDYIFNTAVGRGGAAAGRRQRMNQVNVTGSLNLIEATKDLGYQRLIHFGSSQEYGRHQAPLREDLPATPVLPFGATKAQATAMLTSYARATGKPIVVLRPFSVYGYWEAPNRLIPTALMAARSGASVPLTAPGYRRDLVFMEDVIEATLLSTVIDGACGEIINVGSGRQYGNGEIVAAAGAATGRRIPVIRGAYAAHESDTGHWLADISKARSLLGWQPRHTLAEGLAKTADWLEEHCHLYEPGDLARGRP